MTGQKPMNLAEIQDKLTERLPLPDMVRELGRFNAWHDQVIAAAEQRGAEKAFDEAVEEIASMEGNRLIIARYKHLNPYRADQEGDDENLP